MEEIKYFEKPQVLCLEGLVGISKKTCECLTYPEQGAKLDLIRRSDTGLYVDEHEGAVNCLFLSKAPCGVNDVWQRLIDARREAILRLILDVSIDMSKKYKPRSNYNRVLGEHSYAGLTYLQSGKQGYSFRLKDNKGGKLVFKQLAFMAKLPDSSTEQVVTIRVKKHTTKTDGTVEVTDVTAFNFRIDMVRKFWGGREPDTNLYDIPPFELLTDGSVYEIYYDYDSSLFTPYDNNLSCNCDGVKTQLKRFYESVPSGRAYGMVFNVDYVCDDTYLLCALANSNQTLKYVTAEAIRLATMYKFLVNEKARATVGTTPSNVLNIKNYDELIGMYAAAYGQSLTDITANYNTFTQELDCFTCNPQQNIGRTEGLFVS